MLITLTASAPSAKKMTAMTPLARMPTPLQRPLWLGEQGIIKESLVEIGEIQPEFDKIGLPLRLVPHDHHQIIM
jgi:hypothetical protein